MQDNKDKIKNLKNYYDKLARVLKNEASFEMFGKAIFDKRRIDDAICCIDANFPNEFKEYQRSAGNLAGSVETFRLYNMLITNIKNKPPMGNSSYLVNVQEALRIIDKLKFAASSDFNYIKENYSGK